LTLRGFGGESKIGTRRSYSIAAVACRFGTALRLDLVEVNQIYIVERFDPGQSVIGPAGMRQNKTTIQPPSARVQCLMISRWCVA
jgi:hypothetical protein